MIQAALLAVITQSPNVLAEPKFDKHVSITQAAEPVDRALDGLSKVVGITLRAPAIMTSEVLLLRLSDVPLRDALSRIATACGGTWTKEGEIYYLGRKADWETKKLDALRTERTEVLRKKMATLREEALKLKPFNTDTADAAIKANQKEAAQTPNNQGWFSDEPSQRLEQRVFALLDPTWLADVSLRPRMVFSSSPNAMERPLPIDMAQGFATYQAEENLWTDRIAAGATSSAATLHPYVGSTAKVTKQPTKALLVVNSAVEFGNDLNMTVQFLDSDGVIVASANTQISLDPDGGPDVKDLAPKPGEQRLTLDPENKLLLQDIMAKFGGQDGPHQAAPTLSPEFIRKFQRPDQHEPLAGYVSQLVLQVAEDRNLNVVADLPDIYMMMVGMACTAGIPTSRGLSQTLQAFPGSLNPVKFEGNWMEVDGSGMSGFYAHRSDRQAMARLFGAWTGGTFPIEALSDYSYTTGGGSNDMLVVILGRLLSDSIPDPGGGEWKTFNLLGALIHQFGDKIVHTPGTELSIRQLDAEGRRVLSEIVYSATFAKSLAPPDAPGTSGATSQEPEELLPNGLPASGKVTLLTQSENDVLVHVPGEKDRVVSAAGVAEMIFSRDHPERNGRRQPFDFSRATFALSPITNVDVVLNLGTIVHTLERIMQHSTSAASFVAYDKLPAPFKEEVSRHLATFK